MASYLSVLRFSSQLEYCFTIHSSRSSLFLRRLYSRSLPANINYSTTQNTIKSRNPIIRIVNFFRNDPFARVSLMFGGTVLVVLLIIESFIPKPQKRIKSQVAVLPPRASHPVVGCAELQTLGSCIPSFYSTHPSVSMVTGPSGSGKTELSFQFAQHFLEHCSPRLISKPSKSPIVLYLDASTRLSLSRTSSFCAHALGIKTSDFESCSDSGARYYDSAAVIDLTFDKLAKQKAKWLLIVDGLTEETMAVVQGSLGKVTSSFKHRKGCVLLTSRTKPKNAVLQAKEISLSTGLSEQGAVELLKKLSGLSHEQLACDSSHIETLGCSPLCLALAGQTLRLYKYFWESAPVTSTENDPASLAVSSYFDVLDTGQPHSPCNEDQLLNQTLKLYIEALSTCDMYFIHSVDFLGSCSHTHPMPVSTLRQHLKNPFYKLQANSSTNPLSVPHNTSQAPNSLTTTKNYLALIKSKLPIVGGSNPQEEILQQMQKPEVSIDPLEPTMMSPFIRVSSLTGYDVELIHLHPSAQKYFQNHFINHTISRIEADELKRSEEQWERTAWFKRFRSFDSNDALVKFLSSLPGLKEGKALTEHQFHQTSGDVSGPLTYTQYLHMASHCHRIAMTFLNEVRYLSKDLEDLFVRKYLLPHVEHLLASKYNQLLKTDALFLETCLLSIQSLLSDSAPDQLIQQYSILLQAHKDLCGSSHPMTANVLTAMAEVHYHKGEYREAESLLKQAISIHESILPRLKTSEQSTDHASTLSHIGLVFAAMGDKQACCKSLEQSLTMYQSIPVEGDITKTQRKLVASTVTDLAHAYIMLGDTIAAKKYLDLAIIAQRGIHGNYHPEVSRTLNVLSIVHALMGDNPESRGVAREAGEIQKELTLASDII